MSEQDWWREFARFFADVSRLNARWQLELEIREEIAKNGAGWLLDYVLEQDELHRVIPSVVHKVLSEHGWSERIGTGIQTRWILTMKGRQALAERKAERELEQLHREFGSITKLPRPLPVLDQIRRYDAEWSD